MRYLVSFIGFPLGIVLVVFRERVKRFTGDIGFAENWFGHGGTYTFLGLLGLAVSILSIMYGLGTIQSLIASIAGPLFGAVE